MKKVEVTQIAQRPVRAQYYSMVVIANNGTIVPEQEYSRIANSEDQKTFRKELKAGGMNLARIFNADAYKKDQAAYREALKQQAKVDRENLITNAFSELGMEANPRLKSALRTLLPLYADPQSNKKAIPAFKNIIKTVCSTSEIFVHEAVAA